MGADSGRNLIEALPRFKQPVTEGEHDSSLDASRRASRLIPTKNIMPASQCVLTRHLLRHLVTREIYGASSGEFVDARWTELFQYKVVRT